MFDVGFSELVVIALVALIVIGPERLPKVARTAGHLLGRLQRYVNDVKADINREMQLDELKKLQSQVAEQVKALENSATQQVREVETSLNQAVAPPAEAAATPIPAEPVAVAVGNSTVESSAVGNGTPGTDTAVAADVPAPQHNTTVAPGQPAEQPKV
jgi:sec-independent protein translocase protein TatB